MDTHRIGRSAAIGVGVVAETFVQCLISNVGRSGLRRWSMGQKVGWESPRCCMRCCERVEADARVLVGCLRKLVNCSPMQRFGKLFLEFAFRVDVNCFLCDIYVAKAKDIWKAI